VPAQDSRSSEAGSEKISTGMLLNRVGQLDQRYVARELHESLLDLPGIWAPSEVFEHESISYRLKGRAFVHMAPPLETDHVEVHVLEGLYALPVLQEMAKDLPSSAKVEVHESAPHRHTRGGELIICVDRENLRQVFQFLLRLYRRERGF